MGKKTAKKKSSCGSSSGGGAGSFEFSTLDVDPRRVRFAHSKIKPLFSGCGRTIEQTLCEIRGGKTRAADLPMITVLLGPLDPSDGQQWFFSLNNRRLFVFKACQEEGLLGPSGLVRVRARAMKAHEQERYTLDRCSVQAKFLFAPKPPPVTPAPLSSTPARAASMGAAEARATPTSSAALASAVKRQDEPEGEEEEEEGGLGSRPEITHEEGPTSEEEQEKRGDRRGVFGSRTSRGGGEDEAQKKAGTGDDHSAGRNQSPRCISRDDVSPVASENISGCDDVRAACDPTQEEALNAGNIARGKKSRRRKVKGKGGAEGEGAAGASGQVEGAVARNGGLFEEVPVALSRKQERARSGRRQRPS